MKRGKFHHLTFTQRLQLEALLKAKTPYKEIARVLEVHLSTIYREVKRGRFEYLNGVTWITEVRYSPDIADNKYRESLAAKGPDLKIGRDHDFAAYIEKRIFEDGLSPNAVLGEIRHKGMSFDTSISINTLYSYIRKNVFFRLSENNITSKPRKKKSCRISRPPRGTSIEYRPKEISDRNTFGHWEMDLVIGKQKTKNVLLVFTERLTRYELIFRLPDRRSDSVVKQLNRLEKSYGSKFRKVFKSITVDNGSEFADSHGLEKSIFKGKRTSVYYCHPYCSSERGSNERMNREIRRKIPKGVDISEYTTEQIKNVQDWLNAYPRRIFGYASSSELFEKEILNCS